MPQCHLFFKDFQMSGAYYWAKRNLIHRITICTCRERWRMHLVTSVVKKYEQCVLHLIFVLDVVSYKCRRLYYLTFSNHIEINLFAFLKKSHSDLDNFLQMVSKDGWSNEWSSCTKNQNLKSILQTGQAIYETSQAEDNVFIPKSDFYLEM